MKVTIKAIGLLVFLSLILTQGAFAQRFVIADSQGDWGPLAPFLHAARGPGYVYTSFVFDSLLWRDTEGQLQPLIATDWQYESDTRCYRFSLHPEAQWHDGQALTASDVVFSFNYLKQHQYRFVDLGAVNEVVAIQDADAKEAVRVCLNAESPLFLTNVAASLPIIPEHIYATVTDPLRFSHQQATTGSGPYQLTEYDRTQGFYRLVAHSQHHLGKPVYDELLLVRMTPQAARSAIQNGEVNAMSIPHQQVAQFRSAGVSVFSELSHHPARLLFNHQARFSSVQARQGIAYLIDRENLAEIAYQGYAQPARVGYRQDIQDDLMRSYLFSPLKGAQLLSEAGWQQDRRGRWLDAQNSRVALRLVAQSSLETVAQLLAYQLENAGFVVTLRLEQDVQLDQRLSAGSYDLALVSSSHLGDPDRFRLMILGQQARSDRYLDDSELLALLDEQRFVLDPIRRMALIQQAEERYRMLLPSLPLVNPENHVAVSNQSLGVGYSHGGIALGVPLPFNKMALFWPDFQPVDHVDEALVSE